MFLLCIVLCCVCCIAVRKIHFSLHLKKIKLQTEKLFFQVWKDLITFNFTFILEVCPPLFKETRVDTIPTWVLL